MKRFILFLFLGMFFMGCGSGSSSESSPGVDSGNDSEDSPASDAEDSLEKLSEKSITCPENFIAVPPLEGYTTNPFCVAKYEMKKDSNNAVSQPAGSPWASITRDDSIKKCEGMGAGYDLITNDEWQTLARNIELIDSNWAGGTVGSVAINVGHSEYPPSGNLAASEDDNEACALLGDGLNCDEDTWHHFRRTHKLSNGEVVWDLAGNVEEWVKDNNSASYGGSNVGVFAVNLGKAPYTVAKSLSGGTTTTARVAKDQFGPHGDYSSLGSKPFAGLGLVWVGATDGTVARGGAISTPTYAYVSGIFSVSLRNGPRTTSNAIGFRCVYRSLDE